MSLLIYISRHGRINAVITMPQAVEQILWGKISEKWLAFQTEDVTETCTKTDY